MSSTSPAPSTSSPNPKAGASSASDRLTPSEIDSLKQAMRSAREKTLERNPNAQFENP